MKLWKKIFLGALIIFLLVFDIGAYLLTYFSYDYSREREIEIGIREQSVILSSVSTSILRAEEFNPDFSQDKERLKDIIKSLAEYYESQGVQLALLLNDEIVYSNISYIDGEVLRFSDLQSKNVKDVKIEDNRVLFVASKVPSYLELTFVYARDISDVDLFRKNISEFFILINIVAFLLMSVSLWLLLKYMTRPISQLSKITSEIANGSYDKRVLVKSSDELGELAYNFNCMADSVENTMLSLTRAAEDKQEFIDDLAHEMKTPITSILGYAEYLKNVNSSKENQIIALEYLYDSMRRLQNLSTELLKLTLLREEKIEFSEVSISDLFDDLQVTMQPIFQKRNMKLVTEVNAEYILGDETLLLSLLTNLVENAARASKENDSVTVRAYYNNAPIIEVEDNGIGIKQEEIEKITAPFYRVDKSRSRKFGGAGLGMSIVSQIVILHNAKLKIKSEENVGTVVRVIFINS